MDRERRSVEILKIRFGDAALQVCSVMLKDVDDSRRVDEGVRGRLEVRIDQSSFTLPPTCLRYSNGLAASVDRNVGAENMLTFVSQTVVHPTIISHHFWPPLESGEIVLSGQMKECVLSCIHSRMIRLTLFSSSTRRMQDKYAKEYSSFKPDKRLKWLSHLGTVHLEVELEDRTLDVDVTPLEAAFLELFSTQGAC